MARLRQQAALGVSVPTASVAVVPHTPLHNKVPSRVDHWSHTRGSFVWHSIGVGKINTRTAPEYPQGHAQCENGRAFSGMAKRFSIPILGMHRSALFGKNVSCLIAQPHSQRYRIANSLTIAAVAGYPDHINAFTPDVVHQAPEFTPEFPEVISNVSS